MFFIRLILRIRKLRGVVLRTNDCRKAIPGRIRFPLSIYHRLAAPAGAPEEGVGHFGDGEAGARFRYRVRNAIRML